MKFSIGLAWGTTFTDGNLLEGENVREVCVACEEHGFDAIYATDHPAPPPEWRKEGGHETLDPLIALSYAGGTTQKILLHTHLLIPAYRNQILLLKAIETFASLLPNRLRLGLGAGYLEKEFQTIGVSYKDRNNILDEFIVGLRRVSNLSSIPIWVGGNSDKAIARAVKYGDGWSPMGTANRTAKYLKTPGIESHNELGLRIETMKKLCQQVGRSDIPEICYTPAWAMLGNDKYPEPEVVNQSVRQLADLGVSWVAISLPGSTMSELMGNIKRFGDEIIGKQLSRH